MKLSKLDQKHLIIIAIYSLVFLAIRLLPSIHGMTYDEAEQFIDTENFLLGYSDQPPLYSWILKAFSLVFGTNVVMMVCVYHLIVFIFIASLYLLLKEIWQEKYSWIILCSFLLFFIFSYDFYRYTIHTALAAMFCSLALWSFIRIFKHEFLFDYCALGTFFALGLLSKYNYLFFIITLVLACLTNQSARKVLFNQKSLAAILCMLLIFMPHFLWLSNNDFVSITYALSRGESGSGGANFLSVILNCYWNIFVYAGVFALFFYKDFHAAHLGQEDFFKTLRSALGFALLLPLIAIVFLKAGNFTQRWMTPVNIFFPLSLFSFIEFKESSIRYRTFLYLSLLLVMIFGAIRLASYYLPDKFGPSFISKPYKAIYKDLDLELKNHGMDFTELEFISFKENNIAAGIKSFYPQTKIQVLKNKNKLAHDPSKTQVIVWDASKDEEFEKSLKTRQEKYRYIFSKSAKYLYSKDLEPYKVNFAVYYGQ